MPDVFIISAVRTPIGKFGGALAELSAADLGVHAVQEALKRSGLRPGDVGEVIVGHARQAGNGPNIARQIGYRAGIPETVPAYTVNQACGSGMKAIGLAFNEIVLGNTDVVVAGGTESMSRVPYLVERARWGMRMGHQPLVDAMYRDGFQCALSGLLMGETAERLATAHEISRQSQDEFAMRSHKRAASAIRSGRFDDEVCGIGGLDHDENVRFDIDRDALCSLPPVFAKDGTVTAGNSSGITDGAAGLVLASGEEVRRRALKPLARVVGYTSAGVDPRIMGVAPVPAVRKLLSKTGLSLQEFGLVEINEAFAAQVLACLRELPIDPGVLNVNGGAIALGHPIGCSGARIVTTLAHQMQRRGVRYGLATLCVSGGLGLALALERT